MGSHLPPVAKFCRAMFPSMTSGVEDEIVVCIAGNLRDHTLAFGARRFCVSCENGDQQMPRGTRQENNTGVICGPADRSCLVSHDRILRKQTANPALADQVV